MHAPERLAPEVRQGELAHALGVGHHVHVGLDRVPIDAAKEAERSIDPRPERVHHAASAMGRLQFDFVERDAVGGRHLCVFVGAQRSVHLGPQRAAERLPGANVELDVEGHRAAHARGGGHLRFDARAGADEGEEIGERGHA